MCGTGNYVTRNDADDGTATYEQVTEIPPRGTR